MIDFNELGQEYAKIILRQETGRDMFNDPVQRYQESDTDRLIEIETIFHDADNYTLNDYVENIFEIQKENQ